MGFLAVATRMNCGQDNITADHFTKILNTENVPNVLFDICDKKNYGHVTVDQLMHFFTLLTSPRFSADISTKQVAEMKQVFKGWLPHGKKSMELEDLKRVLPGKKVKGFLPLSGKN